jgi:DNA-binding NtrC family response regulator
MVGMSRAVQAVRAYIAKVAASDSHVIITGETGTGKELVAELIHEGSRRRAAPFVCINCPAIPDGLLESELFGWERGAFTGASASHPGKLKLADGGTVFFDEIGEMSPYAQAKILRVIETKTVYRLGGRQSISLDVRIVAATNQDLEHLVAQGKFRRDLFFRLSVARIDLPPLRERRQDIPLLLDHYIREVNARTGAGIRGVTGEAVEALIQHDWPGNVRELRNLVEAAALETPRDTIGLAALPGRFTKAAPAPRPSAEVTTESEQDQLLSALFLTNWNKSKAAQRLRWSRMTLYRKLAKYHIDDRRDRAM